MDVSLAKRITGCSLGVVLALVTFQLEAASGNLADDRQSQDMNQIETAIGEKKEISGKVMDNNGEPLMGAAIMVVGALEGTITDIDGNFTLSVPEQTELEASFIGYSKVSFTVDERTFYQITLNPEEIKGVVVVAYGTQKKESVTGAISSIGSDDLLKSSSANLQNALAGRISGLSSIQSSGQPGQDNAAIYLRGCATLNGSSPIILIDGVPRDNMGVLDPNEIESVSVLKDASATAVFGVRGANGAILITTKRGEVGKMQLSVNLETSLQSFTRTPERLESWEWMALKNEVSLNEGTGIAYTPEDIAKYTDSGRSELEQYLYPSHYWYGEMMRKFAPQTKVNINMSGGTDRLQYFINAGYIYQGGQFKVEEGLPYNPQVRLNRFSFRANLDYSIAENLKAYLNLGSYLEKVGMPSTLNFGNDQSAMMSEIFRALMYSHPYEIGPTTISVPGSSTPAGEVIKLPNDLRFSAFEIINRSGYRDDTRMNFNGSYGMELNLPFITEGLSIKGMVSFDSYSLSMLQMHNNVQQYTASIINGRPVYTTNDPRGSSITQKSSGYNYTINMQASLNYQRTFADKHDVGVLFLAQRDFWEAQNMQLPYNVIGFCGRVTYAYDSRYLAEINIGYNGSEQFAPSNRFGFFPAFSVGWVVSNEKFFSPLKDVVSNLKLRGSYGKVGNDRLGNDRFLYLDSMEFLNSASNGAYGEFFLPSLGNGYYIAEGMVGNPNLRWETAMKQNYGIELQLFKKLDLTFDYFYEFRKDILIARSLVPELQGVPLANLPRANMGEMENHGFEIEASYSAMVTSDLFLGIRGNFSFAKNKVLSADEPMLAEDYVYRYRKTGFPYGTIFGYEIDYSNGNGYFNAQEELDSYVGANGEKIEYSFGQYGLGDFRYIDQNGDGVVDDKDMVPIGNTMVPQITYGITLSANYKWLDFTAFFQGLGKTSQFYSNEGVYETLYGGMFFDYHKHAWTKERYENGETITYPRLGSVANVNHVANSFFIMDRSFLRLKNIELGFTFPERWLSRSGISNLRIYISGQNVFTWDRLPMDTIDPEPYSSTANLSGLMYPITKSYNFGINVTF